MNNTKNIHAIYRAIKRRKTVKNGGVHAEIMEGKNCEKFDRYFGKISRRDAKKIIKAYSNNKLQGRKLK